jgi:hypothetical protein
VDHALDAIRKQKPVYGREHATKVVMPNSASKLSSMRKLPVDFERYRVDTKQQLVQDFFRPR